MTDKTTPPEEFDTGANDIVVPFPTLTPRERQVAMRLAEGCSNRAIAQDLFISVKTVDTHRGSIMEKLDLDNNVQLCRLAIREGWLEA